MNRSTKKLLLVLDIILFSVLFLIGISTGSKLIGFLSIAICLPLMYILGRALRCPKCGAWPMKYWLMDRYCRHCGEKLE